MTEQNVQGQSPARRGGDRLFEQAAGLVGDVTRIGLDVVTAPLVVLPTHTRHRVRRALGEVALAVLSIPREVSNISDRFLDRIYEGSGSGGETLTERARDFTDRLSRAAEDFSSTVRTATERTGGAVERASERVDEWVEGGPTKSPPK